ncbi:MAG: GNAT family N-acetyltransferase [Acidobacteriota bacterium]
MTQDRKPAPITLRPAVPDDEAFLYELYCSTRTEEIAAWGWHPSQQEMFLRLQFTAQRRHYEIAFPGADHQIILCKDRRAGRILVFRSEREIRLVDVSLLPDERGRGIGGALVSALIEEARAEDKPVTLHVAKVNRAAGLYRRLGFSITADLATDYKMAWQIERATSGG